jgi:hypothetical protein
MKMFRMLIKGDERCQLLDRDEKSQIIERIKLAKTAKKGVSKYAAEYTEENRTVKHEYKMLFS